MRVITVASYIQHLYHKWEVCRFQSVLHPIIASLLVLQSEKCIALFTSSPVGFSEVRAQGFSTNLASYIKHVCSGASKQKLP